MPQFRMGPYRVRLDGQTVSIQAQTEGAATRKAYALATANRDTWVYIEKKFGNSYIRIGAVVLYQDSS